MLSDNAIQNLVQPLVDMEESMDMYIILKIANRLRMIQEMRPSDIKSLRNMFSVGADVREINKEIAKKTTLVVSVCFVF